MSPRARQRKSAADACFRVLVIDDEQDMLTNLRRILGRAGHDCHTLDDPAGLEAALEDYQPHLVLTDLVMPQGSGMDVLERAQRFDPELPVIILTAHGSIEGAVEALHKHAADYLTKPFSADDVLRKIQRLLSNRLVGDNAPAPRSARGDNRRWRKEIIGVSPVMERLLELTQRVARTDVNVLVAGASGTGKEVIARAIHRLSGRAREIFVPVDCASLPENLLESELFGYRRGAFTGATSDKMGLIEFAHKGTLFLDEIGEMPLALQAKLLRVLQERQFRAHRRARADQCGCAGRRRDQCRSGEGGRGTHVPARPLLPAQRGDADRPPRSPSTPTISRCWPSIICGASLATTI